MQPHHRLPGSWIEDTNNKNVPLTCPFLRITALR